MENTTTEFVYHTVAGTYAFSRARPFLARYDAVNGEALVGASTFAVIDPSIRPFRNAEVLEATDYRFRVRYDLEQHRSAVGSVTITYDFREDGPPKLSAVLLPAVTALGDPRGGEAPPKKPTPVNMSLSWVVFTYDSIAFNDTDVLDFKDIVPPVEVPARKARLSVGPSIVTRDWTRHLLIDWSDAVPARSFAGRILLGDLEGAVILVTFPSGMTEVDPQFVGFVNIPSATDWSIQRKTFEYDGRYYAFWNDGTDIVYAVSKDGILWDGIQHTDVGVIDGVSGFDVDQAAGVVLIDYVTHRQEQGCDPSPVCYRLRILWGQISGSFINWGVPILVWSVPVVEWANPSVAIGADGYIWASASLTEGIGGVQRWYLFRSTSPGLLLFQPSDICLTEMDPSLVFSRLVALSDGRIGSIVAIEGGSAIRYRLFGSGGWGPPVLAEIGLPSQGRRGELLSATVGPSDEVHVVYVGDPVSQPGLRHVYFRSDDPVPTPRFLAAISGDVSSIRPSVAHDRNSDLHVYWAAGMPSASSLMYARQFPGSDAWETLGIFEGGGDINGVTAGAFASSFAFGLFTCCQQGSEYQIQFTAMPTPMDTGSQTKSAWNRLGLSPYQAYFQNLDEYVSPGSGLLAVKQTDLVVPGRGFDLAITRVYVAPRAFVVGSEASPYLLEDAPATDLGRVWALDFPWLSPRFLHLWDGQMYTLHWSGNSFENHDGEHFLLTRTYNAGCSCYTYALVTKSGLTYDFDTTGRLTAIRDAANRNRIDVHYTGGMIDYIFDTTGHTVLFSYIDGMLRSVQLGTSSVTYSYQTVGTQTMLSSVEDQAGRTTTFEYQQAGNPFLLTTIRYPTGGRTVYTWSQGPFGPDLVGYVVTQQDVRNIAGESLRTNNFDFKIVNGRVTSVEVSAYDAGTIQGSTMMQFNLLAQRVITSVQGPPPAEEQLQRTVSWFSSSGEVVQTDVFPGVAATPSHSLYSTYDDWGNLVYTRDAVGHERFASYVNTRSQGRFYDPGRLERAPDGNGLLFLDEFEDRDISDWAFHFGGGTIELRDDTFETAPPALSISSSAGMAVAEHIFGWQTEYVVANAVLRVEEMNNHEFCLSADSDRACVRFSGSAILGLDGATLRYLGNGGPNQWYRIGMQARISEGEYDVWINGVKCANCANLGMAGGAATGINQVTFRANYGTMYVDSVNVYRSDDIVVGLLRPRQLVQFVDPSGRVIKEVHASDQPGPNTAVLTMYPGTLPYGTLILYDPTDAVEFTSPVHEFWGGDVWGYTLPWEETDLPRTRSGFGRTTAVYLDEQITAPPGTFSPGEDGWNWGPYDEPVSGNDSHRARYLTTWHGHSYRDAPPPQPLESGDFLIQYVQVPEGQRPSSFRIRVLDDIGMWHDMYWGSCPDCGPGPVRIGNLPTATNRWIALLAKADDVGMAERSVTGVDYSLYGGNATWDLTARSDSEAGVVQVSGLAPGTVVSFFDAAGTFIGNGTVPPGMDTAGVNLYDAANSSMSVRSFPSDGYVVLSDGMGNMLYQSPVMHTWPGDVYTFDGSNMYPNLVMSSIHDRLAAVLEYQTGRSQPSPVPQETYFKYTYEGWPSQTKVRDGSVFREAVDQNDVYGHLTKVTDPLQNTVDFEYSGAYGAAYLTGVTDDSGHKTRATYDPVTGRILSSLNPRGYRTRYEYDLLGRPTGTRVYDLPVMELAYYDMEWTTEGFPKVEDLSGRGNHATIGCADWPDVVYGRYGLARDFDGEHDCLVAQDDYSLDRTSSVAISFWLNHDYSTNPGSRKGIIYKGSTTELTQRNYAVTLTGDLHLEMSWSSGSGQDTLVSASTLSDSERWYHVIAIFDWAFDSFKLFLDGSLDRSKESTVNTMANDGGLVLGRESESGPSSSYLDGTLDEVRLLSDGYLDTEKISALREDAYGLVQSDAVAYDDIYNAITYYEPTTRPRLLHYDMETLLNGKMEDLAGHGVHGTLHGTISTEGRHGAARLFDGTSYIEAANTPTLNPEGLTLAVWVQPVGEGGGNLYYVAAKGQCPGDYQYYLAVHRMGGNWYAEARARSRYGDTAVASSSAIVMSEWTHLAMTYDGSVLRLYVNGIDQGAPGALSGPLWASGYPLRVGHCLGSSDYFLGAIDEVQMLGRALDPTAVEAIYDASEKGFYDKRYFDSLGRMTEKIRRDLFGALVSVESYGLDFRDRLVSYATTRGTTIFTYDFLSRPTSATYPETSNPATIVYDDINRIRTVTSENGRKMQFLYDVGDRTIAVREYYDSLGYHTTSAAYDEVGNLLEVTNARNQVTSHQYDGRNRLQQTTYPDDGYEAYTYDEVGNLKTKIDRTQRVTYYFYTDLYQVREIDYYDSWQTFSYDENGNMVRALNPGSEVDFEYDALDRTSSETDTVSQAGYEVNYAYDDAGRLTQMEYPDDTFVDYSYDSLGRTDQVRMGGSSLATFSYFSDDLIKEIAFGNGVVEYHDYWARGWPRSIKAASGMTTYLDLFYLYDESGNLVSVDDLLGVHDEVFSYDKLDRLWTASGGFGAHTYSYDELGNRVNLNDAGNDPTSYEYDNGPTGMNTLTSTTTGDLVTSYLYDVEGNTMSKVPTEGSAWSYEWNSEGFMTRALRDGTQQQEYSYDALGRRVKVAGTSSSTWTISVSPEGRTIFEEDELGSVTKYVYANGILIAKITPSAETQYYLGDRIGTTKQVRDSSQDLVFEAEYEPFGTAWSVSGTEAYQFAGERRDDPTALTYLRARQYDPDLGRFVSADSVLGSPAVPQSMNRYSYAVDNPLRYLDPSGLYPGAPYIDFPYCETIVCAGGFSNVNPDPDMARNLVVTTTLLLASVVVGWVCGGCTIWGAAAAQGLTVAAVDVGAAALSGETITAERVLTDFVIGAGLTLVAAASARLVGWALSKIEGWVRGVPTNGRIAGVPAKGRVAVVGDDMGRVEAFAKRYGYEYFNEYAPPGQRVAATRNWIIARMDEGYTIVDIGPAPGRPFYPHPTGPYYRVELLEIGNRNYERYLPMWGVVD